MDERFDSEKIDDAVLAMLFLTQAGGGRAWKSLDWDALDRLHEKGSISDPVGKAKSVVVTQEGLARAEPLALALFGKGGRSPRDPLRGSVEPTMAYATGTDRFAILRFRPGLPISGRNR